MPRANEVALLCGVTEDKCDWCEELEQQVVICLEDGKHWTYGLCRECLCSIVRGAFLVKAPN